MAERNSASGRIIGAIVVAVIVALVAWWYFTREPGVDFSRRGPAPTGPAIASTAPPPIEHPITQAQTNPPASASAPAAPLPPLDQSDSAVAAALEAIPGADGLARLLIARALIPHIVATVDALPRHTIGDSILPLQPPGGKFVVDTSGQVPVLDARNYARYDPYMRIVKAVDSRTLVTWYVHWYPLFQQAYEQLGFPHGYFNDRLIQAIDNMLEAPNAQVPPALVKTQSGLYAFADPTWESLSVGQKLLIRMGPSHERTLKTKLRNIRALLLGEGPRLRQPAGPASAASAP